jgi:hypothetical protein
MLLIQGDRVMLAAPVQDTESGGMVLERSPDGERWVKIDRRTDRDDFEGLGSTSSHRLLFQTQLHAF